MTFLSEPRTSAGQQELYDQDVADDGFVWDLSRLWGHQPELWGQLRALIEASAVAAGLSPREKAMLVLGQATMIGDSYCSVAWGRNLTRWAGADTAVSVLTGADGDLTGREQALLHWVHRVAADPNATTAAEVQPLRDAGFEEAQILALTTYAALRIALSIANDALGARPDAALADQLDPAVRAVITWGRQPA